MGMGMENKILWTLAHVIYPIDPVRRGWESYFKIQSPFGPILINHPSWERP
jgi:hypothetical protein